MPLYQVTLVGSSVEKGFEHDAASLDELAAQLAKKGFVIGHFVSKSGSELNRRKSALLATSISHVMEPKATDSKPAAARPIQHESASNYSPRTQRVLKR